MMGWIWLALVAVLLGAAFLTRRGRRPHPGGDLLSFDRKCSSEDRAREAGL